MLYPSFIDASASLDEAAASDRKLLLNR